MTNTTSTIDLARVEAFAGQVSADLTHAYHSISVHLGDRLGLWRSLADLGSATSAELAERSGLAPRYVHEWLCVQAAAGYVVLDASSDGGIDTFTLPAEHAMVLADDDSPPPRSWRGVRSRRRGLGLGRSTRPRLHHRRRNPPWHAHDSRLFTGVERFYGTIYRTSLLAEWVPAVDGLSERLTAGIDVLDVGCGLGVPTILLAEAFPKSRFVGVDTHAESVERATAAAIAAGGVRSCRVPCRVRRRLRRSHDASCSSTHCTTSATRWPHLLMRARHCGREAR